MSTDGWQDKEYVVYTHSKIFFSLKNEETLHYDNMDELQGCYAK